MVLTRAGAHRVGDAAVDGLDLGVRGPAGGRAGGFQTAAEQLQTFLKRFDRAADGRRQLKTVGADQLVR